MTLRTRGKLATLGIAGIVRREVNDGWVRRSRGSISHPKSRQTARPSSLRLPKGQCRLLAPLTHELAASLPMWSRPIAPWAEYAAHTFGQAMQGKYVSSTPLTARRSVDANAIVRARGSAFMARGAVPSRPRQAPEASGTQERWCLDCGGRVTNSRRVRCDDYIGADSGQTEEIRGRRAQAIASRKRALVEWEQANPDVAYDPDLFRREILPGLKGVKLSAIVEATGISKGYASNVRSGKYTPHVSTWRALAELLGNKVGI